MQGYLEMCRRALVFECERAILLQILLANSFYYLMLCICLSYANRLCYDIFEREAYLSMLLFSAPRS